jgi:phage-related minor tail protein
MSENSIELQIVKPKRVYKRKPKETPVEIPTEPHVSDTDEERSTEPLSIEPQPKSKRSYTRKPKVVQLDEILSIPPPPTLTRQSNIILETQLIDSPPTSPKCVEPHTTRLGGEPQVNEKKPRTEKQIAAFNKMRDARLAKQAELTKLKELEREEKRIDSEKVKLDKVTEQVINKATEIKKKRASRKKVVEEVEVDQVFQEPRKQYIQEKTHKPILFV